MVLLKGTVVIGKISQLNHLQRTLDNSFFIEELVKSRKCASLFLETSCKVSRESCSKFALDSTAQNATRSLPIVGASV